MLDYVDIGHLHFSAQGDRGVTSRATMVVHKQKASMSDDACLVIRAMVRSYVGGIEQN